MTTMGEDLPPEMQAFARLIDAQPLAVQEAFQFCLAIAMQEAGKFELMGVTQVGDRIHYAFQVYRGRCIHRRPARDQQRGGEKFARGVARDSARRRAALTDLAQISTGDRTDQRLGDRK